MENIAQNGGRGGSQWDAYEEEILDLFVLQNKTLTEVMAHMEAIYNFHATFPNMKNLKQIEWVWVGHEIHRRSEEGKESQVCLHNRPLDPERVARELSRHKSQIQTRVNQSLPNPSPARILVRTPPPGAQAAFPSPVAIPQPITEGLVSVHLPWATPDQFIGQPFLEPPTATKPVGTGIDIEMEMEPVIDDWLFLLGLSAEVGFREFDFNLTTRVELSQTSPSQQQSPRRLYIRPSMSPASRPFDFDVFGTLPGFELMTPLPYFRLLSIMEITELQRLVPERYDDELSFAVTKLLDPRPAGASSLHSLFGMAAYFASNSTLDSSRMDAFLKWVIEEKYSTELEIFLQINTPTIRAFVSPILGAAIRIKDVKFLRALESGLKFEKHLTGVYNIGDVNFTNFVLSRLGDEAFNTKTAESLFQSCVKEDEFELATTLVDLGVSVDCYARYDIYIRDEKTVLCYAAMAGNVRRVKFLLELGANANATMFVGEHGQASVLSEVVRTKDPCPQIVLILLENRATTACKVEGQDLLEWSSLHRRKIYPLLKRYSPWDNIVTVGDLLAAATKGRKSLKSYIDRHDWGIDQAHLEAALQYSIRKRQFTAAVALLQHGIDPDCPTRGERPLLTAIHLFGQIGTTFSKLLIEFGANANIANALLRAAGQNDVDLMRHLVQAELDVEE
ncbi:Fc.00g116410.m01.CDS01 [Cosmosporella sp. VM-42]